MSTATLEPKTTALTANEAVGCPHCRKTFQPAIDRTQAPRLQGAKCPHCRLMVPLSKMKQLAPA